MVRLVKGAYWDSEIKRAQVDGLDGYPVYTRKAYTDVAYLACARRLLAAPDAVFPQFATHNAHTLAAIYELAGGAARTGRPVRVPVPARHGRAALRAGRRPASPTASSAGLAASTRRSAPTRRCSPTSCGACSRTAPTPRSSTASPTLGADRRAGRGSGDDGRADRRRGSRRAPRVIGRPHPAIALPREIYGARATQFARPRSRRTRTSLRCSPRPCERAARDAWTAAPMLARATRIGDGAAARDATSQHDAAGAQSGRPRRRRRPRSRGDARRRRARRRERTRRRGGLGGDAPPDERAAMLERAADSLEADLPRLLGLLAREAGKTCAERHRRSARGGRLPPLLRRPGAARPRRRRRASARPGRLHQPVELPARDLHRPGRRRARRRQPGARQAGRADAADRRRDGAAPASPPACRAPRCSSCPAAARRSAPRSSPTRASRASCSPARPRSPACCRRASPTRSSDDGRAVTLIAETGGQNAMLVDSSALAEQVVERRRRLGVRQRRPALLGAARALPPGGRRRPHRRDAEGRDGREPASARPRTLAVDVGPVIDAEARAAIEAHVERDASARPAACSRSRARLRRRPRAAPSSCRR